MTSGGGEVNEYIDYEVENGNTYSYALQAIDRAYNIGQLTEEQQVLVGITLQEINAEEGGNLKFDECEIYLPPNALQIDRQIVVAELPLELPENNNALPVSPVYSAMVLDDNNEEEETEFPEPVTMVFSYENFTLPEGYEESDLGVYWFNKENGEWEKLEYAWNNIEEKKIYVQVKHFSEYQMMASKYSSPSLQSYYDLGVSPLQSYFNNQQEIVSTSNGSLAISATDLILPGRDGFDLVIQRLYDSTAAQQEKLLETNEEEATHKAPIDTFGNGWSLNLPWIEKTDKGSFLRLPEGQTIKIEMKNNRFEYHEGIHFVLEQEGKTKEVIVWLLIIPIPYKYFSVSKYILTLKDGTRFEFDSQGRPTKKISPSETGSSEKSEKNEIYYEYDTKNNRELKKITDSIGRKIDFIYKTININTGEKDDDGNIITITKRRIGEIKVDNRIITYDYDPEGYLVSVKDPLGRETAYCYNTSFLCQEGIDYPTEYTVRLLDQIIYPTGGVSCFSFGKYENKNTIWVDGWGSARVYYYTFKIIVKEHQLLGKITEYHYNFLETNNSWKLESYIAPYTYISSCTIKERPNVSGSKGGKIIVEYYDHLIGEKLFSRSNYFSNSDYKGSLLISRKISLEDASGQQKEYETVEYEYDIPIRAITKEIHKRNNNIIYEITNTYDDAEYFDGERWGNLTSRIDGRTKLEERYKYTNHPKIKNLVEEKTVKNWNDLTKEYSVVVTSYKYNELGKPITMTVTDGEEVLQTTFTYDEYGNLTTKTEPNNLQTVIIYDEKKAFPVEKRLVGIRDADGQLLEDIVTRYGYSLETGMKEWEEDPRHYQTKYEYDLLNRLTKVILPDDDQDPSNNPYREYIFDDQNNRCDFYNENRYKTTFNFDELGRLVSVIKGSSEGIKTEYVYDGLGRIREVIDPLGNKTTYEYDFLDRVTKIIYPDQNHVRLEYDDITNIVTIYEQDQVIAKERSDWSGRLIAAVQYCHYEGYTQLYNWFFTYDSLGNKIRQINPYLAVNEHENQTDYYFDAFGRMSRQVFPSAALLREGSTNPEMIRPERQYKYDKMGNLIEETDSRGNKIRYEYDLLNRLVKTITESTDGFGQKTRIETKNYYDPAGNKIRTTVVDVANPDTPYRDYEYSYSARGFLLSEDIVLERDASGEAIRKQNIGRYRYDAVGNKIATIDPRNNYDAPLTWYERKNGQLVTCDPRKENERTYTTWYLYDELNRLYRTVLPDETPPADPYAAEIGYDNLYTETKYDANGNPVEERDASGLVTSYTYTPRNWVETVSINGKLQERYVYDHRGNKIEVRSVTETENVLDKIVRYKYDSLGRLRQVNYPLGEERYEYDSVGNRIAFTDGRGNTTRYKYNGLGWLVEITDPLSNTTRYQYDLNGNQVLRIAANELKTYMKYDELNRLIRRTDSLNYSTRYSYDPVGNLARMEDPRRTLWEYEYYPNNLLHEMKLTGAGGETYHVSYTYDAAGNRTQVTDPENTIIYHPDPLNRVTATDRYFDGATYHTGYRYEKNLLTGIQYPGSDGYLKYTYNDRNLVSGVTGFTQSISYYPDGTLKESRYLNNVLTTYNYDENRRLKAFSAENNGLEILKQQYEFDLAGNITRINDRTYEYDGKNQLVRACTPGEFMEEEAKAHLPGLREGDYLGNVAIDFNIDNQAMVHLDYNSSSIGLDFGMAGAKVKKLKLVPKAFYATHRLTANTIEFFASQDNSHFKLIKRDAWEFEKDKQGIITITFKEVIDTRYLKIHVRFDDRDILFNPVNKATFINQLASMVRVYQQASERIEEYQYDAAGNRTKMSLRLVELFHYDYVYYEDSDRLKSDGKYAYSYDEAGNLIYKTKIEVKEGEEPEDWEYEYDLLNRLRRVKKNGKIVSEYKYDPEGFRVVKKTPEHTIHYVFDGTEPIFEKNVTTGKVKSYVYALGKHLARVDGVIGDPEAEVYFYHTDHLGSIKAVTNIAGEVVWNADYLAFGTRFSVAEGSAFEEWHGFTGKEYNPDTGLYYFNARWYDSEIGRFISEDPAADPNNPNLYTYCANNPLRFVDPTGLRALEEGFEWELDENKSGLKEYYKYTEIEEQVIYGEGEYFDQFACKITTKTTTEISRYGKFIVSHSATTEIVTEIADTQAGRDLADNLSHKAKIWDFITTAGVPWVIEALNVLASGGRAPFEPGDIVKLTRTISGHADGFRGTASVTIQGEAVDRFGDIKGVLSPQTYSCGW